MTVREIVLDVVRRREDQIFLVDAIAHREIKYKEFHERACALAAELRRIGVGKGDRIGVMVPNCCELAILYFACIYLGAVIVPINPGLSHNEVQFILSSSKPVLMVVCPSCAGVVQAMHPNVINLITRGQTASAGASTISIELLPEAAGFFPLEHSEADDLIVIMYTSGTTAKPKGFAHRIGRMFRNAQAFASAQGINEDTRFYLTLSMAYMGGLYNLLVLPFLCGASVVVDHVFDARSSLHFWDKAKNNGANALWFAPTVMAILLRMDRGHAGEEFCRSSIRHVFVGFAPLPLKMKDEFESRYGVRLIENYGLSETLFVTARPARNFDGDAGYVGEALSPIQLRIVNREGEPIQSGSDGEVQILTPDLMAGYLDANGNLLDVDAAAWFSSGDIGRLGEHGSLFITGRKKDIIIRGGINISPAAIEEVLIRVQGIADAAVVSTPHQLYGEDIVAVIKLEPGLELASILDSIVLHARRNLAQHQQPARYVAIDEFPRTASGKVQKSRIRELVAEKLQIGSGSSQRERATEPAA
jgi:acyl-coenzyme A synthetase/AMP-(fatty) acid ligase